LDPRPDISERVLWGIEREGVKPLPMPKKRPRLQFWFGQLYFLAVIAICLRSAWRHAPRDELGNVMVLDLLQTFLWPIGGVLAALALLWIVRSYLGSPKIRPETGSAMPLWLSDRRLTYVPQDRRFGMSLPLNDIKTASLDYDKGSLAVRLKTASDTVNLLSSDAENLLKSLYTLRPDLQPNS